MRQALVISFVLWLTTIAAVRAGAPCGHCHSGHRCACESCESYECVKQPDHKTIKKVVYDVKCIPVCEHRPSKFLHCDCCPECQLKYKRVLVKREVVVCEICTTKCVPVKIPCGGCKSSCPLPITEGPPLPPLDAIVEPPPVNISDK